MATMTVRFISYSPVLRVAEAEVESRNGDTFSIANPDKPGDVLLLEVDRTLPQGNIRVVSDHNGGPSFNEVLRYGFKEVPRETAV